MFKLPFRLPLEGRPTIFRRKISGGGNPPGTISRAEHEEALVSLNREWNKALFACWNAMAREEQKRREVERMAAEWETLAVQCQRELHRVSR